MPADERRIDADVVVVTYNSGERILRCIEHLRGAGAERVIVVDNGSSDGTPARVASAGADVELVALPDNIGFGRAVNAGAARGTASAIVLVNDDAYVEPEFLRAITSPLASDPACGMVAGRLTILGTDLLDGFGVEVDRRLVAWSRGNGLSADTSLGPVSVPSGGAAAYRRTAFDTADGFDDALFAYWEDVDLGLRLANAGWTCAEAPDARGEHEGGASFGKGSPLQRRLSAFGRGFVMRRYRPSRLPDLLGMVLFEVLHVGALVMLTRSVEPLTHRVRGWRAAKGRAGSLAGVAIADVPFREAIRRLAKRI